MKSMRNVAALALCTSLAFGAVSIGPSIAFAADEMPAKSDQPVTDTWITTKVKTELATTARGPPYIAEKATSMASPAMLSTRPMAWITLLATSSAKG